LAGASLECEDECPMRKKLVLILGAGHLCADMNQGAIPALLPFFIATHHYSYAAAAGLVFMPNLVSTVFQPFFGWLADRFSILWLVPCGILAACIGVGLLSVAPNYWLMMAVAAVSGFGLAGFHPQGARLVSFVSSNRKATAMSIFAVGGNAGFAIGPIFTFACVSWMGLPGVFLLLLPALAASAIYLAKAPEYHRAVPTVMKAGGSDREKKDEWWPFVFLAGAAICRSIVFFGLNTFLVLYWIDQLHRSKAAGSTAVSIFIFAGSLGTLIGGSLADLFGRFRVILISLALAPALLFAFLRVQNATWALAALVPLGVTLFASFSVMIVEGQHFLLNHRGVASGVMLGVAGSVGGVATPIFGRIADRHGMHAALAALESIAVLAVLLAGVTLYAARVPIRARLSEGPAVD
jgi:MFS transporter, FSR family, fosmidomycin resistance protein